MPVDVLLGLQWGDEGKGKIVDLLAPKYDVVARFQGGPNAGHTLLIDGKQYVLHTLPSGMIHSNVQNVIGSGMVVDPLMLKDEIDTLKQDGVFNPEQLKISRFAHLILPSHKALDAAYENKNGKQKIGSTLKGIGPAYMDKMGRSGLRIGDALASDFDEKYQTLKQKHKTKLAQLEYNLEVEDHDWLEALEELRSLNITDTEQYLNEQIDQGNNVLAEGAQGSLLDISFGTYPYVTSSNTVTGATSLGLGIPPQRISKVYGVFKAYTTRVGKGPFPTELDGEIGDKIKEKGNEFGSTTGRPRRCGWLDLESLRYSVMLNGVDRLMVTKADVLDELDNIQVCTKYQTEHRADVSFSTL
ncbi:MAG: adenylosuccinate synthase, partial [Bacteroidetes bacterium SW_10_40_5]